MKHGAVVVKGGRVVGTGFNKNRNSPLNVSEDHIKTHCSEHAEVSAIKDADFNVKNAVIYVARVSKRGENRNSKPCDICFKIIKDNGIKKIIYTVESHESRSMVVDTIR
jgi:deoxycytidylate deaminase